MAKSKRSLPSQLAVHQTFAMKHYQERLSFSPEQHKAGLFSVCADPPPHPPKRSNLLCPLCGRVTDLASMSVEHAPPKGGQSSLGSPGKVAVLTCETCNNDSGASFERDASDLTPEEPIELTPEDRAALRAIRRTLEQPRDVRLILRRHAFNMTDLKAAFVIAFTVLGYRWALSPALQPVREGILNGTESDQNIAQIVELGTGSSVSGDFVLEVGPPERCIVVVAETGRAVVLPMVGVPQIPWLGGHDIKARAWPWPLTAAHAQVNEVQKAYRAGMLFHGDLCHRHPWPIR